jgi:hypothetical protein
MTIFALIGATALYLLFAWLISAAVASWMTDRKGYGERLGLTFGLLLSVVGLLIVLLLPGRPHSKWKLDGPLPWSGRPRPEPPPSWSEPDGGEPPANPL